MAGIDGINSMVNTYWDSIQNNSTSNIEASGSKDYSDATDEELMDVCKEFEAYFLEQMFKAMRNTVPKKPLGRRWHLMSSPVKGCEFSVHYVWNGARARLRWNSSLP